MQLLAVPAGLYAEAWPPVLATRSPGSLRALHAHHAMHFVLAVEGELRVRAGSRARWRKAAGVFTAPDSPHAIDSRGADMLVIFFDPESDVGATLQAGLETPLRLITGAQRTELV